MLLLRKWILGLFAVLCLMQYVEMARMRRDAESNIRNLDDLIESTFGKRNSALSDDTSKDIANSATKPSSEGPKSLQEMLDSLREEYS